MARLRGGRQSRIPARRAVLDIAPASCHRLVNWNETEPIAMQMRTVLRAKIHRATVTEADVDYIGSLTLDENLMDAAGLVENEMVAVADLDNGERLETYIIRGERGSGVLGINGAAALKILPGHKVIVFSYAQLTDDELATFEPRIIFVDDNNHITDQASLETARTKYTQ
jgi:aspartate 1-decarboxylase